MKMNLLKKIKKGLVERGAEPVRKPVELIELGRIQAELTDLREDIRDNFTALGGEVYVLYTTNKLNVLQDVMKSHVQKLERLRDEMEQKEERFQQLHADYEVQSLSLKEIQGLLETLDHAEASLQKVELEATWPVVGKKLCEMKTHRDVSFGLLLRNEACFVPSEQTEFKAGDVIFLIGKSEPVLEVLSRMQPENSP